MSFLLKAGLPAKALLGVAIMAAALKYVFYQVVGGGFFRPDLPAPVMLTAEALYAALLMLFVLALVKDAAALVLRLCRLFGFSWHLPLTPGWRCGLLMLVALSCGAWGTWQAVRVPDVRTVNVAIPNLPAELEGFTLAQLSDLHIGPVQKKAWLAEVVRKTNALSPDAVVITGDMIDGLPSALRGELTPLADLRPRYGVFGVTGNHEYYYDARGWIKEFQKLGVVMLNNEHRVLPGGLVLGGVPDSTAERFGGRGPDVEAAFAGAPDGVRVLLCHKPNGNGIPAPGVALQLSGHTHGGLIFFLRRSSARTTRATSTACIPRRRADRYTSIRVRACGTAFPAASACPRKSPASSFTAGPIPEPRRHPACPAQARSATKACCLQS